MAQTWGDADTSLEPLNGQKVAVIGYGIQGDAQACNMRDSGLDVVVGLRPGGAGATKRGRDVPGAGAQARRGMQPLNGGALWGAALASELKEITRKTVITPEMAEKLFAELDTCTPLYYTRKKRRDPFEDLE